MKSLQRELLLTIAYTTQFNYPLTEDEVIRRRIKRSQTVYSAQEVRAALAGLQQAGFLSLLDGYYFLTGHHASIKNRLARQKATARKFQELQPLLTFLKQIPWVSGVAVTGSAALGNADHTDDIDLLIITENNRLWLVRPFVICFAFLQGKRRSWQREEKNSWCFNLWLEHRSVAQPTFSHSLYIAYEVCQTQWLIDRSGCQQHFFESNAWVQRYLPEYYDYSKGSRAQYASIQPKHRLPILSEVLDLLNMLAYQLQRWYMQPHMTRERVALSHAFFHPRDTKQMIFTALGGIVEKLAQRR